MSSKTNLISFVSEDLKGRTRSLSEGGKKKSKMAVPMLRGCLRIQSTFGLSRMLLSEISLVRQPRAIRVRLSSPGAVAGTVRQFSSDKDDNKANQKVVVVGIPNPFIWFRTRIYYFLIRAYFDKDFNIEEFTEGAKQVCKNSPCKRNFATWHFGGCN